MRSAFTQRLAGLHLPEGQRHLLAPRFASDPANAGIGSAADSMIASWRAGEIGPAPRPLKPDLMRAHGDERDVVFGRVIAPIHATLEDMVDELGRRSAGALSREHPQPVDT
jgi:hypothetical protein